MASRSPYHAAADLVNKILSSRNSPSSTHTHHGLKSFLYDKTGNLTCSAQTYALVHRVINEVKLLEELAQSAKVEAKNTGLLLVLLSELLLGPNKSIKGGGSLKRSIMEQERFLRQRVQKLRPFDGTVDGIVDGIVDGTVDETFDEKEMPKRSTTAERGSHSAAPSSFPRYVRLNTFECGDEKLKKTIQRIQGMNIPVAVDPDVPDLLILPAQATGPLLQDQSSKHLHDIVLQDKSSCFPALCLVHGFCRTSDLSDDDNLLAPVSIPLDGDYMDACAAPGNKTSHLAALLSKEKAKRRGETKGKGSSGNNNCRSGGSKGFVSTTKIFALDRDQKRYSLLKRRIHSLVPTNLDSSGSDTAIDVVTEHKDFLAINASDYPTVKAILLDPSCSGSGIVTSSDRIIRNAHDSDDCRGTQRGTHHGTQHGDENGSSFNSFNSFNNDASLVRLEKLSGFQITALRHAMSSFPSVDRVVYSTCSVHMEENEHVVAAVLSNPPSTSAHLTSSRSGATNKSNTKKTKDTSTSAISDMKAAQPLRTVWEVIEPQCLSHWKGRGVVFPVQQECNEGGGSILARKESSSESFIYVTKQEASCMIRANPELDDTNGFFVCCFQRKRTSEGNVNSAIDVPDTSSCPNASEKTPPSLTSTIKTVNSHYNLPFYQKGMFKGFTTNTKFKACNAANETNGLPINLAMHDAMQQRKDKFNALKQKKRNQPNSTVDTFVTPETKAVLSTPLSENHDADINSTTSPSLTLTSNIKNSSKKRKSDSSPSCSETKSNRGTNISKKHAKRLDWKALQQQKKIDRIKAKRQKTKEGKEISIQV